MAVEIERKFLVANDGWRANADTGTSIRQGYLSNHGGVTTRVRLAGDQAWLTIKGATEGISRAEYEYEIPVADAEQMLASLCQGPLVEKHRYHVRCGAHVWDLDVFSGANSGLAMAEVELRTADEHFELPNWAGIEVSEDPRYFNAQLAISPYRSWSDG